MHIFLTVNLCILFIFTFLGYLEAKRLTTNNKDLKLETLHHHARYIYLILITIIFSFIVLGIPMSSRTLMWMAPIWFDLYSIPLGFSITIGCFSFLFSLVTIIAIITDHKEKKGIALASVLIILVFPILQYQHTNLVYPKLNHVTFGDGIILQSHPSSCAAASGANIARTLGIEKTEKEIAKLMNTSIMNGTNAGQAIYGMKQVGIICTKNFAKNSNAEQINAPAMLFIDHETIGPESHAVSLMGFEGKELEIWDPLEGKVLYSTEQFKEIWHGKSLVCSLAS